MITPMQLSLTPNITFIIVLITTFHIIYVKFTFSYLSLQ